jgi:hypothetical protein
MASNKMPLSANGRNGLRGRPFTQGNPGRKPGSKNKATLIAAALLADEAEELVRTAIKLAKAGDKDMLKFFLNRVLPKERAITIDLPAVDCAADAVDALAAVAAAASRGEITPAESRCVSGIRVTVLLNFLDHF